MGVGHKQNKKSQAMGVDDFDEYHINQKDYVCSDSSIHSQQRYRNAAREYAQALRPWLNCYHYHNYYHQMNAFQQTFSLTASVAFQMLNSHPCPAFSAVNDISTTPRDIDPYAARRPSNLVNVNRQTPTDAANNIQNQENETNEGVRMKIPTFWKRVAAELIDFAFLFYIKMIISISLVTEFNLDYVSLINGEDIIERFNDLDYDKAFAITFEVIALEIINRVLITIFETMCLCRARARGRAMGATPGKRLMGLRVVSCDTIQPIGNGQVFVSPAGNISVKNAFLRSVIKNFTIAFFLPACLTLFFFKHNRTAYDVVAHTVVVEEVRNI